MENGKTTQYFQYFFGYSSFPIFIKVLRNFESKKLESKIKSNLVSRKSKVKKIVKPKTTYRKCIALPVNQQIDEFCFKI